jgi:hypothetical protein
LTPHPAAGKIEWRGGDDMKKSNIWWNGSNEIVTISDARYALEGWNGETWSHCWRVLGKHETDASKEQYEIRPIYSEELNDNDGYDIIGYEVI